MLRSLKKNLTLKKLSFEIPDEIIIIIEDEVIEEEIIEDELDKEIPGDDIIREDTVQEEEKPKI